MKAPPQAIDAEMALIGSVLNNGETFAEVSETQPADFYKERHRKIWTIITELHNENKAIDIVTVTSRLKQNGEIDGIGGAFYLTELMERVPSAARAGEYRNIVLEVSTKRHFIDLGKTILDEAQNGVPADGLFENVQSRLYNMVVRKQGKGLEHISIGLEELRDRIEKLAAQDSGIIGLPTGYNELDRITLGLQEQQMIVLAARPGMGKTSFALSVAHYLGAKRIPAGFFSLEMSLQQLQIRLLALDSTLDSRKIRTGKMSDLEWAMMNKAFERIEKYPIYLDDSCRQDPGQLRDKIRRAIIKFNLKIIFVDYLQLMISENVKKSDSRATEVGRISEGLKSAAKEFNIPIVVLSQLNRACEKRGGGLMGKMPRLDDIRESGAVEQDADIIFFLMRPEVYWREGDENTIKWRKKDLNIPGLALIKIAKGRDCEDGVTIPLKFLKQRTQFLELDFTHEEA